MTQDDSTAHEPAGGQPLDFDPAMMAAELAALQRELTDIGVVLSDPDAGLVHRVDEQGRALAKLMDTLSGAPSGPWHYGRLCPQARRALHVELGQWVTWFEGRYLVNLPSTEFNLPPCWYLHPVAVELLTALMVAHRAAYSTEAVQPSHALVDWHVRAMDPVFMMLRGARVFDKCVAEHREPAREAHHDPVAFDAWVKAQDPAADAPEAGFWGPGPAEVGGQW